MDNVSFFPNNPNYNMSQDLNTPQMSAGSSQPSAASGAAAAGGLGWLGGPKGAAAMATLQMMQAAAERQRKERMMEYESRVQKLRGQQNAAAAGQQMAQSLRF